MQRVEALVPLFDYAVGDILAALPQEDSPVWEQANFRQSQYAAHQATRSIVFRWPAPGWQPGARPVVMRPDYAPPALLEAVNRCADAIGARLGGEVTRATLAELPAGAMIKPHRDTADRVYAHRCHLPIVTNEAALLLAGEEPHHLRAGTVYEFDNTRWHSARNGGATRRVHLLCDVLPAELMR